MVSDGGQYVGLENFSRPVRRQRLQSLGNNLLYILLTVIPA
jgi:sn-glycerol 3-phosphate transport system permease protein